MVKKTSILLSAVVVVSSVSYLFAMKGLLEKKIWYRSENKSGEATYWVVYLGEYKCSLLRKFPGEEVQPIEATVNFNLLSSGYIEGIGYSSKGKIDAQAAFAMRTSQGVQQIEFEQIECIYDYGRVVRLTDGTDGELLLDIEGTAMPVKKMHLRIYKFREVDGDRTLKEDDANTDINLNVLAFSKQGLNIVSGKSSAAKPAQ